MRTKLIQSPREIPVMVSARILRHMSRGIYRTPAGALKELVSNAYDAGATKVTINTGYPLFEKIIITDNGKGMSELEFKRIIQNIGLTDKVAGLKFKLHGTETERVTIGHYGVGILAIGQLSKSVKIMSKTKNTEYGFEATLDFEQFEVKKSDGIERSVILDEQKIEQTDKKLVDLRTEKEKPLAIGKCIMKRLKFSTKDKNISFTKLELEKVRDLVHKKLSASFLQSYPGLQKQSKYSANFEELLKLFRKKEDEIRRGQYPYEKLCWELATYSPLSYPNLKEFSDDLGLQYFKALTDKHKFEVVIDGMKLFKPYEKDFFEDPKFPIKNIFVWTNEDYTKGHKVSGYIIVKQHIRPKCMQGVLVRVSGVAVGMYDLTFLEYPYHEAAKFEQLTGELFVEGLSGALNIDRNSFNETDEDYLALVKWFHGKLYEDVFKVLKKDMAKRRREAASTILTQTLSQYFQKHYKDQQVKLQKLGTGEKLFHKKGEILYINRDHPEGKPRKTTVEKLMLASILVVSGRVTVEDMETLLTYITKVQKDMKEHE